MRFPSVLGVFSGCGGLDFGFKNAGFNLKWSNELVPSFAASYEDLCGTQSIASDFWEIFDKIPSADVIVGGPPCQSFSLVGKRIEDDPRGRLVGGFVELIRLKKPRAFLMENVAGLSASRLNGMRLSEHLQNEFTEMGYSVLMQRVLASDYFVPQKRNRLIVIGVLDPIGSNALISPEKFSDRLHQRTGCRLSSNTISVKEALDDLPNPSPESVEPIPYKDIPETEYSKFVRLGNGDCVSLQVMPTMSKLDREFVKHIPPGGNYEDIPDSLSTTRIKKFKASGGRTTTYGRLAPDKPAYTINTYFNRPNVGANYHYSQPRLITVREALRLQSFPDWFSPVFRNQRELHTQIGNAVPPLLAEALAHSVKSMLYGD